MTKTKPTNKPVKDKQIAELLRFAEYLQKRLGLQSIDFSIDICALADVTEDAAMLGVDAKSVMGHNDSARPGYSGVSRSPVKIKLVLENHKDFDEALHTLAHEILHTKLWWCAPISRDANPVVETLLEETINRIADVFLDGWISQGRKK